jgi:hypothetical protein
MIPPHGGGSMTRGWGLLLSSDWCGRVTEMGLAQDEKMIQALAAKGADDPLDKRALPGRARGDAMRTSWIPILLIRRANSSP